MSLRNLSSLDRTIRLLAGVLLLGWGWAATPSATEIWPVALRLLAWLPLVTGLLGWCPVYAMLGLSTHKPKPSPPAPEARPAFQKEPEFSYNVPRMRRREAEVALSTRTLWRWKGTVVLAALAFLLLLESVRQSLQPHLQSWDGRLLLSGVLLAGILFFFGAAFQLIERMQGRLDDFQDDLQRRQGRLAVAEERLRIANEMHDGLAQVLAYVNTKAQVVREHLKRERAEEAAKHLDQLAAAAREIYTDTREAIIGLRSAASPESTTAESLREYAATWEAQNGIRCRLHLKADLRLPGGMELQVLRIIQEALANVRKHSKARNADVWVEPTGDCIRITVQDDGVGFNPTELGRAEFPRFGLSSMRERAESVGALFQLDSTPGEGTKVTIEVPAQLPNQEISRGAVS